MATSLLDQIDDARRAGRFAEAVGLALGGVPGFGAANGRLGLAWGAHIAGAASAWDTGCVYWDYWRQLLATGDAARGPADGGRDVEADEAACRAMLARWRPDDPTEGIALQGMFATVRAVAELADGRCDLGTFAQKAAEAARAYAMFWGGAADAYRTRGDFTSGAAEGPPPRDPAGRAAWAAAVFDGLDDRLDVRRDGAGLRTGLAIARRALFWVLGVDDSPGPKAALPVFFVLQFPGRPDQTVSADLVVVPDGPGRANRPLLYPDPIRLGLTPLSEDWRRSFDVAADYARRVAGADSWSYRWHLEFPHEERRPHEFAPAAIAGRSAGAGACCLLLAAMKGLRLDPTVGITAAIDLQGELRPVGHPELKARGAGARGVTTLLVASQHLDESGWDGLWNRARKQHGVTLTGVRDVAEALHHLTGRVATLAMYRDAERAAFLGRLRRGFLLELPSRRADAREKGLRVDGLNVDPYVERGVDPRAFSEECGEPAHDAGPGARPAAEPFEAAFGHWLRTGHTGPLVLLGRLGAGKTWLGLRLAARLLDELLAGPDGLAGLLGPGHGGAAATCCPCGSRAWSSPGR